MPHRSQHLEAFDTDGVDVCNPTSGELRLMTGSRSKLCTRVTSEAKSGKSDGVGCCQLFFFLNLHAYSIFWVGAKSYKNGS